MLYVINSHKLSCCSFIAWCSKNRKTASVHITSEKKIMASSMIIIAKIALAMKTVKQELSIEKVMPFMTTLKMDLQCSYHTSMLP